MKIEVVLTEADIEQEFAEAIEARDLPEKFFFWFPRSAGAWAALSKDDGLFGGLQSTWRTLAAKSGKIASSFGSRVPVISFGSGDGGRDRLLLGGLKDSGHEPLYFPVDASQAMLELACAGGDDEDIETVGIKADISSPVHLVYAADAAEAPRIFVMSGNTMAAFDPLAQIRYIAQCMTASDRLIIDGELYDEEVTMARRDNPPTRRFVATLLANVGIGREDGEIRFDRKRDERREGLHLVTRYFRAERDLSAIVAGEEIALQRGERIGLNFQYAYTPDAFRWLLRDQGGLEILEELTSPDERFLTAICAK
jgi:uncharacterized SAM-dependent methyltransferase